MLRFFVLLLLLLNGLYFAWSQGLLRDLGFAPVPPGEPQRLTQQLQPEAIRIVSPEQARRIDAATKTAPSVAGCLQAGPFDAQAEAVLRPALEATLPHGSWTLESVVEPARWIIYMGKYPNAEAVAKKRRELVGLNVSFEALTNRELEWGLSLGHFDTEAQGQTALLALARRGVRTAQVVQEYPEAHSSLLRIPVLDDAVRERLVDLKPALGNKPLQSCG